MTKPRFSSQLAALIVLLLPISLQMTARDSSANQATKALQALFDAEWDYTMEQNPTWASQLGDRRWNDRWEDASLAAIEQRHGHASDVLARLKKIDRRKLSPKDQLNYDLFQKHYETATEEHAYHWYLAPLNQREGIQTADELADALRFETVKDYEDWIARLRSFPVYLDQTIALMREGIRERIVQPKIVMQRVPRQIDNQIVAAPEKSPFYKPFQNFAAPVPDADRKRLARAASEAIAADVIPAYRRLKEFFVGAYLPACFEQVGAWQLPNGDAMYAFFARKYTTTRLSPPQIHEIGLREVKRIRDEMQAVMDQVVFKGTRQEFFKFLRADSQFYYQSPEELLTAYRALTRRIDPNLVKIFRTLPRMPYGVEPIPDKIAPDTTTAYYRQPAADGSRAGTYFVNLYKPETRPKWEMMALSLHESVPGHHLQIALAYEQGELPSLWRIHGVCRGLGAVCGIAR